MEKIKTKNENPNGLYQKYLVQKIIGVKLTGADFFHQPIFEPMVVDVDEDAEYFVLRLDDNVNDKKHLAACRKAILVYAEEIKDHIPQLSVDLIERHSNP